MRKNKRMLALMLVIALIVWALAACAPQPARRPMPNDANNGYRNYNPGMQSLPYTAQNGQNRVGSNQNNNNSSNTASSTSSMFSQMDNAFASITDNINIRSGPSATTPINANLNQGDIVKVVGKLNGWYVVNVPNTNKVGCISPNYTKLYSGQPTSNLPPQTKSIPNVPTAQTSPYGTSTPSGGAGGTTTGAGAGTGAGTGANTPTPTGTGTLSSQGSRILQLVNAERAKNGARALRSNADLNKLATMKSQDIVEKNYFSHQSPTYGSPFDMMKTYGISYMYAGENLAIDQDADRAFQAWMNSEGHRRNILNPDFTDIGIGLYPKGNGSYAYTQMFIGK